MSYQQHRLQLNQWKGTLITLAGPIGVGKTTLLKLLQQGNRLRQKLRAFTGNSELRVAYLFENVEEWEIPREGAPQGMLKFFYDDPKAHGFQFQMYVFDQYVDTFWEIVKHANPDVLICERFMTCQKIFADLQSFTPIERAIYDSHWRKWTALVPSPDLVFRMETSSEHRLMKRVRRRARDGETPIQPRKPIRRSASGLFLGGDEHLSFNSDEDDDEDGNTLDRAALMFSMDMAETAKTTSTSSDDDEIESSGGVTLEYQRRLIDGHRKTYPIGHSSPYDMPFVVETVLMDADPPYHKEPELLEKLVTFLAAHIYRVMRRNATAGDLN